MTVIYINLLCLNTSLICQNFMFLELDLHSESIKKFVNFVHYIERLKIVTLATTFVLVLLIVEYKGGPLLLISMSFGLWWLVMIKKYLLILIL